jgi:RNA-directed DNA polymerase
MMESRMTRNCHVRFGERNKETHILKDIKVRFVPTPCSPLLANIYLHQLDLYWWNKYGNLNRKEKERRRTSKQGNCALIRYADDWLILTNGGKAEALRLKEEFGTFLKEELKLELNSEKTHVTHVNQGFNFLGFHIQRYVSGHDRPKMLVTPAPENVKKLMLKIKQMTKRKYFQDSPLLKFSALNAVLEPIYKVNL